MGTESVGSSGSSSNYSALAALWAQQQAAAAEAARRAAEAARRAAEEARRKAEEAARVAAEARRKADEQRRAAERAEAQADKSTKKTDIDNAAQQRELAKAAEAEAVKQEAVAHLRDKEATLSESKAQDAEQGRAANAPSEGTRAAQAEVAAATETARVYEKGPVPETKQKDAALKAASDNTQTKLTAAEKAVNVVNEAHENGHEASDAEIKASVAAVNDWLDASQHEMRLVGLGAQAEGKDSQAAVKAKADQAAKSLDGNLFDTKQLNEFINKGRDQVLGESGAMRQVRSEQYTAQQAGEKQLADAHQNQPALDAAADKAEKIAAGFTGAPQTDSQMDAKNKAQQDALETRAAADAGKHQVEGLTLAYEGSTDEKTGRYTPGSVSADYEARAADIGVKESNDEYQRLNNNGIGGQALTDAGNKLDASQANQRLAHADLDVANTKLELADTRVERDAAQANQDVAQGDTANTLFGTPAGTGNDGGSLYLNGGNFNTPGLSTNFNTGGDLFLPRTGTPTYVPLNIDGSKPFNAPGGKHQVGTPFTAGQLGQTAQGANAKYTAADQKAKDAVAAQDQAYNDLIGDPGKTAPALDTTAWLGREKEITDTLEKAHTGVTDAQDKLHQAQGTGKNASDIHQFELDVGKAKEAEITAQADADTLKAMRDVRDAQRREASGETIKPEDMSKLRATARDKLKASMEAGPSLSPENETKARDALKTKQDDLKNQDAAVKSAFWAHDRATGTKDEESTGKTLKDAQDKRGNLDRDVRGLQTLLDQIDTRRLTLAADQEYKTHNFAKPEKRMSDADENGNTSEYTWLPKDYNATSTILPDANGKPKAEGLPPGLKPENVEVKKEDGKWKVHFKEDSDHIGYIDGEKFYKIEDGDTIEMDATTAAVWEAHSHSDAAAKARGDYEQEMQDIGVPPPAATVVASRAPGGAGTPGAPGAPGAPAAERPLTLSFVEDLGTRRQQVNQQISDYTQSARHDPGPEPDDIKLARLELHAIDLAIDWQEADQTRQGQDAAVRGGLKSTPEGKSPQEIADEKREAAKQARQEWINESNKLGLDKAKDDQKTKQDAHDKWKKEHPYLLGSERDSTTWKDLQAANGDVDQAQRRKVAGANVQADIDNKKFIADHLSPDKMNDPAALYDLFMQNPQVMAQSIINQHYMAYGSQPMQMLGRTHLSNEVGIALGWTTDVGLDPNAPDDAKRLREGVDLFTKLNKDQKETHDAAVKSIVDIGGEDARVTVLPVVYGMPGENGGIVKTALFKVEQKNGGDAKFVDDKGRQYDSVRDFRANNQLPVEGVNLAMPEDGKVTLDEKGNVKLFTGDARTETGWETFRRKTNLDVIVGVAGLVAGVVLAVGSLGTLTAPAALLMAASITTLAASAYGVATSAENLINEAQHGVDINPLTNRAARMDWLNGALSLAAVPGAGSAARASTLAWRAARAGKAAEDATGALRDVKLAQQATFKDAASNAWQPGKTVQRGLMAGNVGATEENVRYMADNWANMSPADRKHQIGMLGLSLAGFASHPLAKVYNAGHQGVKSAFTSKGGTEEGANVGGGSPRPAQPQEDTTGKPLTTPAENEASSRSDDASASGPRANGKALDQYRDPPPVKPELPAEPAQAQRPPSHADSADIPPVDPVVVTPAAPVSVAPAGTNVQATTLTTNAALAANNPAAGPAPGAAAQLAEISQTASGNAPTSSSQGGTEGSSAPAHDQDGAGSVDKAQNPALRARKKADGSTGTAHADEQAGARPGAHDEGLADVVDIFSLRNGKAQQPGEPQQTAAPHGVEPAASHTPARGTPPAHGEGGDGPVAAPLVEAAPDNVVPLHPAGPPEVPAAAADAPLAPVADLTARLAEKNGSGHDPDSPETASGLPTEAEAQVQVLRRAAGGEDLAQDPSLLLAPPAGGRRGGLYAVTAQAHDGPVVGGNATGSRDGASQPGGGVRPESMARNSAGGSGPGGQPRGNEPPSNVPGHDGPNGAGRAAQPAGPQPAEGGAQRSPAQQASVDAEVARTHTQLETAVNRAAEEATTTLRADLETSRQDARTKLSSDIDNAQATGNKKVDAEAVGPIADKGRKAVESQADTSRRAALDNFDRVTEGLVNEAAAKIETRRQQALKQARTSLDEAGGRATPEEAQAQMETALQDAVDAAQGKLTARVREAKTFAERSVEEAAARETNGSKARKNRAGTKGALKEIAEAADTAAGTARGESRQAAEKAATDAETQIKKAVETAWKEAKTKVNTDTATAETAATTRITQETGTHRDTALQGITQNVETAVTGAKAYMSPEGQAAVDKAHQSVRDEATQAETEATGKIPAKVTQTRDDAQAAVKKHADDQQDAALKTIKDKLRTASPRDAASEIKAEGQRLADEAKRLIDTHADDTALQAAKDIDAAATDPITAANKRVDTAQGKVSDPARDSALALASVPGLDPAGQVMPSTTTGLPDSWKQVASFVKKLVKQEAAALKNGSASTLPTISTEDLAIGKHLMADPPPGSDARFVVSKHGPSKTIYGKVGVRTPEERVFKTFDEAAQYAAREGGAWVHRVEPNGKLKPLSERKFASADEVMGSIHVDANKNALPVAIPNIRHQAWGDLLPTGRAGRAVELHADNWRVDGLPVPAGYKSDASGILVPDTTPAAAPGRISKGKMWGTLGLATAFTGLFTAATFAVPHMLGVSLTGSITTWRLVAAGAFAYRSFVASGKATVKMRVNQHAAALDDPTLSPAQRETHIQAIEKALSRRIYGVKPTSRGQVSDLAELLRSGPMEQRPYAAQALKDMAGGLLSDSSAAGVSQDTVRGTSFGISFVRSIGNWMGTHGAAWLSPGSFSGYFGTVGSLFGALATNAKYAARLTKVSLSDSELFKRMPALSSAGDAASMVPLMVQDAMMAAGQSVFGMHQPHPAVSVTQFAIEAALFKMLAADARDDFRALAKKPPINRVIPPLLLLLPGAAALIASTLLFPSEKDKKQGGTNNNNNNTTPSSPLATTPPATTSSPPAATPSTNASPSATTAPPSTPASPIPSLTTPPAPSSTTTSTPPAPTATTSAPIRRPGHGAFIAAFGSYPVSPAVLLDVNGSGGTDRPAAAGAASPALNQFFNMETQRSNARAQSI